MKTGSLSITLIGPGGAGKSTVGAAMAERLGIAFIDLDARFADRAGDIGAYIKRLGYDAYAKQNIETYRSLLYETNGPHVAALSSGLPHEDRDDAAGGPQWRTSSCFVPAPTCRASSVLTEVSGPFPTQTAIAPPVTAQVIASFASPARST